MSLRNGYLSPVKIPEQPEVKLTEVEAQICTLFDECTTYLKQERSIITSCRIAGGWVRDKLLGLESNDIDIALSDIMGISFAEHFVEFAQKKGVYSSEVAKIASNPDQSKHLETATFRVLGKDLDLVNLRSEEYAGDSRIPNQVAFGTPLQDALRRDITINALFYNIHSRSVEDLTNKGLDDLRHGIIRTPLSPAETFHDDPLRVIRCVRFASRFGFVLASEVEDAAKHSSIQVALEKKVSRERVGEELTKMMKGRDPLRSMKMIHDLHLYNSIFRVLPAEISEKFSPGEPSSTIDAFAATAILHALIHPDRFASNALPPVHPLLLSILADESIKARLYLATALTPFKNITYPDHKKRTCSAVGAVIRESLKLGTQNHFLDGIPPLFASLDIIRNHVVKQGWSRTHCERVAIGLFLREKLVHNPITGSHWTTSLLFALVQELVRFYNHENDTLDVGPATQTIEQWNTFVRRVVELDLPTSVDEKSILDGREIVSVLGARSPGPWVGQVLARVVEWRLEHPTKTKQDCMEWLKEQHHEGILNINEQLSETRRQRQSDRGTIQIID